ncbi:MAG: dinitrogenase iron-molybdenum cofactor biosynthesis protein [Deltaproteobacteria bacterium]|nr:dinitrogenase iron-molybdenum cofactor biosynthesis protein [Deltaproteobacteria bacterium]
MKRILIPLWGDDIAPRFDLAPEALIAQLGEDNEVREQRIIVLPQASPEGLCDLILRERIDMVVCCAVEEEFYQYLTWKKVDVVDGVAGSAEEILARLQAGRLESGDILLNVEQSG